MRCRSCRHWRRLSRADVDAMLTVRDPDGREFSLRHLPGVEAGLRSKSAGHCGLRDELATSDTTCEHHSLPFFGLLRPHGIERENEARAAVLAAKQARRAEWERVKLAEMSAPVVVKECATCHRIHARCKVCNMPFMFCGKCPACAAPAMVTEAGGWLCRRCNAQGDGLPEPLTFGPDGLCDGCREAKGAA